MTRAQLVLSHAYGFPRLLVICKHNAVSNPACTLHDAHRAPCMLPVHAPPCMLSRACSPCMHPRVGGIKARARPLTVQGGSRHQRRTAISPGAAARQPAPTPSLRLPPRLPFRERQNELGAENAAVAAAKKLLFALEDAFRSTRPECNIMIHSHGHHFR